MGRVQKLVTENSFDANGVFIPAGHVGSFEEDNINGNEQHLADADALGAPARVEIAALGPTGPNPTTPQQIPPDAVQTAGGSYVTPGKTLVSEVTNPADQRLEGLREDSNEAEVSEALAELVDTTAEGQRSASRGAAGRGSTNGNADDALVDGTVSEVTADLGSKTDEQLQQLRAAENDREKPRSGVLSAIDKELAERAENK